MVVTKISSNKLTVATGESVQVWSRKTRSELGGRAHPARHDIGIGLVRKPAMNHKKALHGGRASLRIASNKVSGLLPDTARYMAVYAAFLSFFFKLFSLPSCLAIFALRALISFFRLVTFFVVFLAMIHSWCVIARLPPSVVLMGSHEVAYELSYLSGGTGIQLFTQ